MILIINSDYFSYASFTS